MGSRGAPQSPRAAVNAGTGPSQANAINSAGIVAGWSNVLIGGQQYQDAATWTNGGSGWVVNDNSNAYTGTTLVSNNSTLTLATATAMARPPPLCCRTPPACRFTNPSR